MRTGILSVVVLCSGCAVSHGVRPLEAGQGAITASLGGPISADLPTPIAFVVPITTIGYAHGLTDRLSVHGALHPTGLLALGVFAADIGATGLLLEPSGAAPRLMVDGDLILATGKVPGSNAAGGTLPLLDVQLIASWDLGDHAVYAGIDQLLQPLPTVGYHVTPLIGGVLAVGRTDLQLEYMWLAPHVDNELLAAQFIGPLGAGASSVKLGLSLHLGPRSEP